ncbi:MAG: iron-only hydrogenase system regulator [Clostridiales bacterium]|nr:iron-only hydrogenase system regulator [Clostridiales bacterium]
MAKIAVIGAVLENPESSQQVFNDVVSEYKEIIRGRMGLPMNDMGLAVISITVLGELDTINSFVGRLGKIAGVTVKAAFSKGEY